MPETMPAVRAHPGEPFYFFSLRSIARLECSSRALWETVGHRVGDLAGAIPIYMGHPLGRRYGEREVHNHMVPASSPGGSTTSHKNHRVMSLRPGDHSPLVCPVAGSVDGEFRGGVRRGSSKLM
jgi:hypothetical protein